MAARLHDWQSRLAAVIESRAHSRWVRGPEFDCCGFAGACVSAVTGSDPLAAWGKWATTIEAMRIIRRHGSLRAAVGHQLGAEVPVAFAQPGDIGLFIEERGEALAVCGGSDWLAPGRTGLVNVQASAIVVAWRCTGECAGG